MILLLRLWLEKCDLKNYVNNYALTLLVIASLQHDKLLPSIKHINQNSEYDRLQGGKLIIRPPVAIRKVPFSDLPLRTPFQI